MTKVVKFPGEVQEVLPGMETAMNPDAKPIADYLGDVMTELGIDKPEAVVEVIKFLKQSMDPITITFVLNPMTFAVHTFSHTPFPIDARFYRGLSQAMLKFADGFTDTSLQIAEKALEEAKAKEAK